MQSNTADLSAFPRTRADILRYIKDRGSASLAELATSLNRTRENVRQQLLELSRGGWVEQECQTKSEGPGRPTTRYALTVAGDHLFPKHYDALTLTVLDIVEHRHGKSAVKQAMADLTDANVAQWQERLAGMDLSERIDALRGIYFADDPYTEVDESDGEYRLIEKGS